MPHRKKNMGEAGPAFAVLLLLAIWAADLSPSSAAASPQKKPHIVFILADDLGWGDVGWHNPLMPTPTLNRLAREGMILDWSYVQPTCSPSRAALMSGRYPYHLGLQHETVAATKTQHLLDDQPILPQTLKTLGYATHIVGKWHLGFCNWRYTPTYRGFDSFYGYYNAAEDYYNHTVKGGYDFRDDDQVDKTADGHYSTYLFTERATSIIRHHDPATPLFLYFSLQAVHTPLEVPHYYVDKFCPHIQDHDRALKCGMIAMMDESVQNLTKVLEHHNLLNDTLLIFSSDNGGPVKEAASNWPLRGSKITIWEGGTRAPGFVSGPMLQKPGTTYSDLFHITDWYPTLVEAAGGNSAIPNIDGVSQWKSLLRGSHGPRNEFVYNIDDVLNNGALRQGRFKLIQGYPRSPNGWYATPELVNATTEEPDHVGHNKHPDYMLFNLHSDPAERKDIKDSHQDLFQQMKARLDSYRPSLRATVTYDVVRASKPENFGGNWTPGWC